jgi:hypothetical protein
MDPLLRKRRIMDTAGVPCRKKRNAVFDQRLT